MNSIKTKLKTRDLSKVFSTRGSDLEVLRNINIDVGEGEFISIVGASGCGKTTFLRLLNGLITPSAGSVTKDGQLIRRPGREIAFVFQQDCLLPWRTIAENTVLGPEMQHQDMPAARKRAAEMLRLVGLQAFSQHYPHELSGGMRQRVNLARALTVGADVLLMDEPFAALDAQTRVVMQAELTRIWQETGVTIIFVTHQIDEAVYLSDRVLVFTSRPGRLKETVLIKLPRPRDLSIKFAPEFVDYTNQLWTSIEEEVRTSMAMQLAVEQAKENAK